jgi:hypothetical protein
VYASPDDEATAHLLVVATFHEAAAKAEEKGDLSILRFSQGILRLFDERGDLPFRLYDFVRHYAQEHASLEEQAALDRWIAEKTSR